MGNGVTYLSRVLFQSIIVPPCGLFLIRPSSLSCKSSVLVTWQYSPWKRGVTWWTSNIKIWTSFRNMNSGLLILTKCFSAYLFFKSPSAFHVNEVNLTVDGAGTVVVDDVSELVTGDEEVDSASTARVELSIVSSL